MKRCEKVQGRRRCVEKQGASAALCPAFAASYPEADVADTNARLHREDKVALSRRAADNKGALGRGRQVAIGPGLRPLEPAPRLPVDFDLQQGGAA